MKRLFDILLSGVAFIFLSPLLIPVMVVLKFTGEGYIFYTQQRVGRGGENFDLLKFATMLKDSPNLPGGDITQGNDPRVLPFGRFLRKTKINELPQILNILKGDISVVGPRPLTPKNYSYYTEEVRDAINGLKPGLTGIGSIVFRDEESILANSGKAPLDCYREDISPYKGKLEMWYKNNQSFITDMKLIFLTAWVIILPESRLYEKILNGLPERPGFLHT